ncbi:type VII secretion target [Amycolatopsis aidingensis]|uniref:type VII secretion target n=1 Tax=Amycolatopsis aidingensis TaxID=2842453 RepID=UPI001C0D2E76|nr:type VII secretion target [Amycolatopsis aidingensis]
MTIRRSYEVDPGQLRAHAGRLAERADRLSSIGSGLPAGMAAGSLGVFPQFITAGLGAAMTDTMGAFADTASAVDKVSEGLRLAADQYQRSDEDHAANLDDIGSRLGEDIG